MKTYTLEIYEHKKEEPFIAIESDQPFPAIAVGHLLNPRTWDSESWPEVNELRGKILRVKAIEHMILQTGKSGKEPSSTKFKVCVFCEPVLDAPGMRGV